MGLALGKDSVLKNSPQNVYDLIKKEIECVRYIHDFDGKDKEKVQHSFSEIFLFLKNKALMQRTHISKD